MVAEGIPKDSGSKVNSEISDSVMNLTNKVEMLIEVYDNEYLDSELKKSFKTTYNVFNWHIKEKIKDKGYDKLEDVIGYLKGGKKREVKDFLENYILPPLVAEYLKENTTDELPIKEDFIEGIKTKKHIYINDIKSLFVELVKGWNGDNTSQKIDDVSVDKVITFLDGSKCLK